MNKFQILLACQNQHCATEVSYHLGMLALYNGQPICEECYDELDMDAKNCNWSDLPDITVEDCCE